MDRSYLKENSETYNYQYKNFLLNKKNYVDNIESGIILPFKNNLGGVLDLNYNFVNSSSYNGIHIKYGGKYNFDKDRIKKYDYDAIYLGRFIEHWGHFIGDSVPRLHIINTAKTLIKDDTKFVFIADEIDKIQKNHYEFFELLGINKENIIIQNDIVQYRCVYIPSVSLDDKFNATADYAKIFNTLVINFKKTEKYKRFVKIPKVYFTRQEFAKARISEVGEKSIEDNFRINGFRVISPEKLSLKEQIAIFNKSDVIASLNGTISLNVIFDLEKNDLIVLNKSRLVHRDLFRNSSMRDVNIVYIDAYDEPIKGYPKSIGYGPFFIDITNEFKKYFNDNNYKLIEIKRFHKINKKIKYMLMLVKRLISDFVKRK